MRTHKRKQTSGLGGHAPQEILKFKSSEMAKNASETVNSNVNFLIITAT